MGRRHEAGATGVRPVKLLPCAPAEGGCADRLARLPGGAVYAIGRAPQGIERKPFTYKCAGCKRTTTLDAMEFGQIPEASLATLRAHGLEHMVTKDLLGAGVTMEQIEQLDAAGVDFASLHPQPGQR
jgi:hypothetical protein